MRNVNGAQPPNLGNRRRGGASRARCDQQAGGLPRRRPILNGLGKTEGKRSNNGSGLENNLRDLELRLLKPITSITITSYIGNHNIWMVSMLTIDITGYKTTPMSMAMARADGGNMTKQRTTIGGETPLTASALSGIVNGRIPTYAQPCAGTLVIKTLSQDLKGTHVPALT